MPRPSRKKSRPWLDVLRWIIAVAAMAATWGYGAWKGGNALWISIPGGVVMMFCMAAALSIPVITTALVAVAFIYTIDSGLVPALRNAALMITAIGLAISAWQLVVKIRERDRRRR